MASRSAAERLLQPENASSPMAATGMPSTLAGMFTTAALPLYLVMVRLFPPRLSLKSSAGVQSGWGTCACAGVRYLSGQKLGRQFRLLFVDATRKRVEGQRRNMPGKYKIRVELLAQVRNGVRIGQARILENS
jgi:hypothetical protein